jgi:uncharacterized membrane protein YedE/YeeE
MNSTFISAFIGGGMIGLAAIILLLANGQIAGISGITGGLFRRPSLDGAWRFAFLGGLFLGGLLAHLAGWIQFTPLANRSLGTIAAAGLLVGFGTQIGSGCTSGHGVCGIGRFSIRSLVATLTFMIAGAVTVFLANRLGMAAL